MKKVKEDVVRSALDIFVQYFRLTHIVNLIRPYAYIAKPASLEKECSFVHFLLYLGWETLHTAHTPKFNSQI